MILLGKSLNKKIQISTTKLTRDYCQHRLGEFPCHRKVSLPLKPSSGALLTVKRKKSRKVMMKETFIARVSYDKLLTNLPCDTKCLQELIFTDRRFFNFAGTYFCDCKRMVFSSLAEY